LERIAELFTAEGQSTPKIIVSGNIVKSASSLERLSNVLGRPIYPADEPEVAIRGAAVYVLEKLGYPMSEHKFINPIRPRKVAAREYAIEREGQRKLEDLL
jgi:sugar (pentulose or hexulose) kinase